MPQQSQNRTVRVRALVSGRVQGVFFRDFTRINARKLGLTGWARNLSDGFTVEVLAQGQESAIKEMIDILRKGPPEARVENVELEWSEPQEDLAGFLVV